LRLGDSAVLRSLIESYLSIGVPDSGCHRLHGLVGVVYRSSLKHVHRNCVIEPLLLCVLKLLRHFLHLRLVGAFALATLLRRLLKVPFSHSIRKKVGCDGAMGRIGGGNHLIAYTSLR